MKTIERARLFETLKPPAGGREVFERKLHDTSRHRRSVFAVAGLSVALLVLSVTWILKAPEPVRNSAFDASPALSRLLEKDILPDQQITVHLNSVPIIVNRQHGTRPKVRIYSISHKPLMEKEKS